MIRGDLYRGREETHLNRVPELAKQRSEGRETCRTEEKSPQLGTFRGVKLRATGACRWMTCEPCPDNGVRGIP